MTTITSVMLERPITWHPNFPVLRKQYQWDGTAFPKYLTQRRGRKHRRGKKIKGINPMHGVDVQQTNQ